MTSTRMRKAKFLPVMNGKKSDSAMKKGMSVRRKTEARTVQRSVFSSIMGTIIALPVLSFEGLRDTSPPQRGTAVVILQAHDIFFVALVDGCGRITFHKEPPLFAMMVVLQAQSAFRFDVDGLEIPFAPLVPPVIFSPRADGLRSGTA